MGDRRGAAAIVALDELNAPDLRLQGSGYRVCMRPSRSDFGNEPWFLNLVAEFETDLFPEQLLHRMQKVQRCGMGRKRER